MVITLLGVLGGQVGGVDTQVRVCNNLRTR